MTKQYAERDVMALDEDGGFYYRHIDAMTGEGLHSKSDIAAELGYRDMKIEALQVENEQLWATFVKVAEYLDIDTEKARHADCKPSDIYLQHINRLKADAVREFKKDSLTRCGLSAAAVQLAKGIDVHNTWKEFCDVYANKLEAGEGDNGTL
jgi:hypothetical protein